jgi:hypothetical protein
MGRKHSVERGREFTAEVYRAAAEERLETLEQLYHLGFFALALYTAGVAVESIFRAYRCKIDPAFDSRHNLSELAKAARFFEIVPRGSVDTVDSALSSIGVRWSNNHRFRSDAAMRAFLRRSQLNRGIKGDYLKVNARAAIDAAFDLVKIGLLKWSPSSTR